MSTDITLFDYSPITDRAPIRWPGGKRVAFYVGLSIEHFYVDLPGTATFEGNTAPTPDSLNYGWRDYGPRVGIWRLIESLDKYGVRASALLNSDVGERYPQIIAAGWMGPGLTETFETPRLLSELGVDYILDWTNDDQPYPLTVPGMFNVPYSVELNDIGIFVTKGLTGPDFVRMVRDQLDQLYADSAGSGRVLPLALHPFVTGQALRRRYLDEALDYVTNHPGVWVTTSDEIAEHYRAVVPD